MLFRVSKTCLAQIMYAFQFQFSKSKKNGMQKNMQEYSENHNIKVEVDSITHVEPISVPIDDAINAGKFAENCEKTIEDSITDLKTQNLKAIQIPSSVIELSKSFKFEFWIKGDNDISSGYLIKFGEENKSKCIWKKNKPLIVIVHGWLAGHNEKGIYSIKKEYVNTDEYNIITLDWSSISKSINYFKVAKRCHEVGAVLSYFLIKLFALKLIEPSNVHLMGHSLGAHIVGACGDNIYRLTKTKIFRITGLDPSGPAFSGSWYYWRKGNKRLDKNDAEFVDVIHTARGITGLSKLMGHIDFYPNNGKSPQPGCENMSFNKALSCSHARAYEYYKESIITQMAFESKLCKSMRRLRKGECDKNSTNHMGHNANPQYHGKFYLSTNEKSPFNQKQNTKVPT